MFGGSPLVLGPRLRGMVVALRVVGAPLVLRVVGVACLCVCSVCGGCALGVACHCVWGVCPWCGMPLHTGLAKGKGGVS